ncbi:MAG: hypothetical protein WC822_06915 [Candidatus Paceibacterota bacterium]
MGTYPIPKIERSQMEQLTEEQAISFYNSKEWMNMSDEDIVKLQLFQDRLCLPFDRFHKAIGKVLGRPVWTHEFAYRANLIAEYNKTRPMPTLSEIMNLIPESKRIVVTY